MSLMDELAKNPSAHFKIEHFILSFVCKLCRDIFFSIQVKRVNVNGIPLSQIFLLHDFFCQKITQVYLNTFETSKNTLKNSSKLIRIL